MSYATRLLSRGEEVVFQTRQHWFGVVARIWLWLVLLVLSIALLIWVGTGGSGGPAEGETRNTILLIGGLVVLAVSLIRILLVVWEWQNQEYLVTTRRIIRAEGIFNKEMSDSSLEKVNDARLSQSIFGRIFGYGTLDILTAAEEEVGVSDFPMIADPVPFKIAMLNQKEMLERPDLAPPRWEQARHDAPPMQRVPPEPPRAGSASVRPVEDQVAPAAAAPGEAATVGNAAPAPGAAAATPPEGGVDDLAATLQSLAELRDRGLITPEEFETKKRQLLERL